MGSKNAIGPREPVVFVRSPSTSSNGNNKETDDGYLKPLQVESCTKNSSTLPRFCTMCGRYKGFQMRRRVFALLCTSIIVVLTLVISLSLFYAIIPAVVRSTIAKSELAFSSINIEQIESDHFRLRAELELSRTGSIAATILPPLVIQVDNIGTVSNTQPIHIAGYADKATVVPIDSPFLITNLPAFYNFSRSLIFSSQVVWHLKAKATVQPISRHMPTYKNIPFEKDVRLNALNGLSNVSIEALSLHRSDIHRLLVDLTINIQNPSKFSIELGELIFSLRHDNSPIGFVESTGGNITLRPGQNALPFTGELKADSIESGRALSAVIRKFLTGERSKVEALAGPHATSQPLLAVGMEGLSLSVDMPPFDQQLIASLTFVDLSLVPSTTERKVTLSASIAIQLNSPLGHQSPLNIDLMNMSTSLMYRGRFVGMLNVIDAQVQQLNETTYQARFKDELLVLGDLDAGYGQFAQDFIAANETYPLTFRIDGFASISGSFVLGPLHVEGIRVRNDAVLVGLNGLNEVRVAGISIDGEEEAALRLTIRATIANPGVTRVQLRNFTLLMKEPGNETRLGQVPIDVLDLQPGNNEITLNGLLAPSKDSDLTGIGLFFSSYLNGQTQPVVLYHDIFTEPNATALDLTVSGLSMTANLDGIQTQLIRQVQVLAFGLKFDPTTSKEVRVTGQLAVQFELPSNIHMSFTALTVSIDYTMRIDDGPSMARMVLHDIPVEHNETTNEILMSFDDQPLSILEEEIFREFAAALLLTPNVTVTIEGLAASRARTRLGEITLIDIPVRDTLTLVGYNQFDNGLLSIDEVDITDALSSHEMALRAQTLIRNPSVVYILDGGRLSLDMCELNSGVSLGSIVINQFYLHPQDNVTRLDGQGHFLITEQNALIAQDFISRMVSGIDNDVELRGTLADGSTGTSISQLSLAISRLRIRTQVPGLHGQRSLVRQILLKKLTLAQMTGITIGLVKTLSSRIQLVNPFSVAMAIESMDMRADFGPIVNDALQVGTVQDNTRINIGSYEELLTPYIDVRVTAKLTTLVSLAPTLLASSTRLSLSGLINVTIGGKLSLQQLPLTVLDIPSVQEPAE